MNFDYLEFLKKKYEGALESFEIPPMELSAFYYAWAKQLKKTGENDNYYANTVFRDAESSVDYNAFTEGPLYIFPVDDKMSVDDDKFSIAISRNLKVVSVKNGILRREEYNPSTSLITTKFYDKTALDEIVKSGVSYASIDYIESSLSHAHIKPDREITFKRDGLGPDSKYAKVTVIENDEILSITPISISGSFYGTYSRHMDEAMYEEALSRGDRSK